MIDLPPPDHDAIVSSLDSDFLERPSLLRRLAAPAIQLYSKYLNRRLVVVHSDEPDYLRNDLLPSALDYYRQRADTLTDEPGAQADLHTLERLMHGLGEEGTAIINRHDYYRGLELIAHINNPGGLDHEEKPRSSEQFEP